MLGLFVSRRSWGLWLSLLGKGMAGGSGLASLLVAKDLSPLLPAGRWDEWRGEKGLIFSPQLILPLSLTR